MEQRSCERLALSREIVFDDYNSAKIIKIILKSG